MKELIILDEEIKVLKDLQNNLDKTEILKDLSDYGFIKGIWSDSNGFIKIWLTVDGKQLLRQIENHKGALDKLKFTLDLGIIKIATK